MNSVRESNAPLHFVDAATPFSASSSLSPPCFLSLRCCTQSLPFCFLHVEEKVSSTGDDERDER